MAYAYRYHANSGPTRVNRTSWGPSSAHTPIDIPNKMYEKRLSGNFDRIINSFDRTNAFECVRSAFEQACSKTTKESVQQNGAAFKNGDDKTADCVDSSAGGKHVTIPKNNGMFERQIEENEKKDRFTGHADIVVNGKGHGGLGSSYDRADVGLASKQTPCTDEDVTAYYQDRIYMSQARQLYPLQEDLADWINKTIGITYLTGDNFLQVLDNGVALCQLAKVIRDKTKEAFDRGLYTGVVPHLRGKCWQQAARKSFFSRDNMENFINFCRQLGIHENLLFESDDLVLHAQPRNVILCLLELGRIASRVGVEPPGLVQFEKEIALEEEGATATDSMTTWQFRPDGPPDIFSSDEKVDPPPSPIEKEVSLPAALFAESEETPSVHTDDTWSRGTPEDLDSTNVKPLSELDKRVQIVTRLMQRNCNCSEGRCSKLLKVRKVGEGRYNIAGRNVFIRLLKGRHMMVRVGGGWDTLEHFLTRHDPCQVRVISPHSSSAGQKVTTVNLVRQSPANSTHSINSVGTNNTDKSSDRLSIANSDISPGERSETSNDRSKKRTSVSSIGTKPFKYNSDDSCIETLSSDGKISSNSSKHSAEESCSETSSINGSTPHSIVKQMDTIKKYLATGKTPSTPVRMRSASTSKSSSGRTTPLSCGKISPNVKTTKTSILSERMNGKMSPAGLKLDLTPCNKASVNNRLDSPVDSTRLLSASRANRTLRSSNENRKSMPSALNVSGDLAMRRRSVNIPLTSAKPLKSPNPKSPLHPKSPSKLASSRSNSLTPIFSLKSPVKPIVSSRSNSLTPVAINKSLVSPSSIEKSVRMALPKQDSENKPFLHIRAKYRSPPPRDVPPR